MIDYKSSKVKEDSNVEIILTSICFILIILVSIAIMFWKAV
jgi:hypothetical protein